MHNDTKFFTNDNGNNLYDRFKTTLNSSKYFDALVGYFRTSGFYRIYDSLNNVESIRILVGINTDYQTYKFINEARQLNMIKSQVETKKFFNEAVIEEFNSSEDNYNVELGVTKFKELLRSGKLQIKAFPDDQIHAKVYISRYDFPYKSPIFGSVITGSSNFTENGLNAQYEFNVELKDTPDVNFALKKFEELWARGVDVSAEYVETINSKTWLNDEITPYELYLKFLYEYFSEEINAEEYLDIDLPENYMRLNYQIDAIAKIRKIVEEYKGIFISDVVGLGKTYIAAMYAQTIPKKKLVLCPPPIMDNWKTAFRDFGVKKYDIESVGMLHKVVEKIEKMGENEYDYIFIDEAHRFRNEGTTQYEMLKRICHDKKVILISATPLNNSFYDFYSLITLFQKPNDSDIPGIGKNLRAFFASKRQYLIDIGKECQSKDDPRYIDVVKNVSKEVRDKILSHIMIRRTRTDIKKYFEKDMKKQGLYFPEVAPPEKIIYEFDMQTNSIFEDTIQMIKELSYARYTPRLYLNNQLSAFEETQQRNLKGFMKSRLVKRLESSKYAFQMTLQRSIESHKKFIDMYNSGTVYISKDVNVFDYIDNDNTELLDNLLDDSSVKKVDKYSSKDFDKELIDNLYADLELQKDILKKWKSIKQDFKKQKFLEELKKNKLLKDKKLVIFSESKETGEDLYEALNDIYDGKVIFYSSTQSESIRLKIKENFDPNVKNQEDEISILITTDVLAEGINLHRSNIIINYDLPWNPTKVLQRVGRVNRVGTKHTKIHIFNFFPTAETDEQLGLENNIIAKIQAFHNALGEDAQYISDTEEFTSYNLRGAQTYKNLNSAEALVEDEDENIELKYLSLIREIRDKHQDIFVKIKNLPKKIRTAKNDFDITNDSLITFFRKGKLKKFCITQGLASQELPFDEAVKFFECLKDTPKKQIPKCYYDFLEINRNLFETPALEDVPILRQKGRSNEKVVIETLKALSREPRFTQDDAEYIQSVLRAYSDGVIASTISKKLKHILETELNNLKILPTLKNIIPNEFLISGTTKKKSISDRREIILSEFLIKGK